MRCIASALLASTIACSAGGCARVGAGGPVAARDTVRIGFYEEPDSLNPVITQMAFSSDVMQLLFDGLIRYDGRGRPVPDLARELPTVQNGGISRDGLTITYHLMPNAKWHDGAPLTASDVIFTWHAIMNPANVTPTRVGYDKIASMDAPDPHTVRMHFREPYAPALFLFKDLAQGAIVPEHVLGRLHDINRAPFNGKPIGSGPYILDRWAHGSEMVFRANHAYFRGAPKIEHVVIRFVPNQNTLANQMRAHELDMFFDIPSVLVPQVQGIAGLTLATTSTLHWEHLNFNTRRPPLDDVVVRRALCMAVDEKTIFRNFYHGYGHPAPTHFNPEYGWGDPAIAYLPFDIAAANAALERDGWRRGPDGIRVKNGHRLAFGISTVAGVKAREAIEVFLQNAWRAVGAEVGVVNYQAPTLFAPPAMGGVLESGKTDVALFTWQDTSSDPDDITYVGPQSLPPNGQNDSFYQNTRIGELERAGIATFDLSRRHAAYRDISRILIAEVPEYVLDWLPEIVVYDTHLVGVAPSPIGSDLWNIAEWHFQ